MIAIIADDFSGAAELAGIAAARGLKAEVQTQFDPTSDAEVIAVDTDTRLRTESEAARIVGEVARQIVAAKPAWIYKKTDSVMRGHPRAEIEAILAETGQRDCLFIPANPSKGRLIVDGRYLINGTPLHETVFAHDPDHPRRSALVRELLGESDRILVPDIKTRFDLRHSHDPSRLAAGAADFFGELIGQALIRTTPVATSKALLICGSLAAWETGRPEEMKERGFIVKTLTEQLSPSVWDTTDKLMLAIGNRQEEAMGLSMDALIERAVVVADEMTDLRIGLEGGATAMAFIRRMNWTRFEVIPEGHTGVGTLRPPGGTILCVKPGSYPWPEGCFS